MKIVGFSSIRSDYDLMSPLYKLLHNDKDIEFKIVVSGAMLSKSYGAGIKEVQKDGLNILAQIESLLNSDTKVSRVKSSAILFQNLIEIINAYNPDLLIYAGDREDVLIYATIGGFLGIPTIHFYGGDHVQDGYIDNPIRHATSKLSSLHFVTIKEHKQRLIKMGENKNRIFVIGNIALDRFNIQPYSKKEIFHLLNLKYKNQFALMIFHPITLEEDKSAIIFENILKNLKEKNIFTFVSYPNIDPNNFGIIEVIKRYQSDDNFYFYKNLDRKLFISIYKHSLFIIGNSSSGIIESASAKIPAINVGIRQMGRKANNNVIFCQSDYQNISQSITQALNFKEKIYNIYGDGNSANKAYKLIKKLDFKKYLIKDEDILDEK